MKRSIILCLLMLCFTVLSQAAFTDADTHWAKDYIESAAQSGLVNGFGDNTYRPNDTITRAQFVTILWRNAGSPNVTVNCPYTDVANNTYYTKAVIWAYENSIAGGIGGGKFDPNGLITREQAATILYRMNGDDAWMMFSGIYDKAFSDVKDVSSWSKNAIYWSIYREIWCGTDSVNIGETLSPKKYMLRGQAAVMLVRFQKQQEVLS